MRIVAIASLIMAVSCASSEPPMRRSTLTSATGTLESVIRASYPQTDAEGVADCMSAALTSEEIALFASRDPRSLTADELALLAEVLNRESTLNCIAAAEIQLVPEESGGPGLPLRS
jgi:hypothetical protein